MNVSNKVKRGSSISIKLVIIASLMVIFFPIFFMVQGLITERSERREEAVQEVSAKWGKSQTVTGPVLVVPYNTRGIADYAYFLPNELKISGAVKPEVRSRGIYDVPLYETDLKVSGDFEFPRLSELGISENAAMWDKSFLTMGVNDMRGVTEEFQVNWSGQAKAFRSGDDSMLFDSGMSADVNLSPESRKGANFEINLKLRGSEEIKFLPVGKQTSVEIASNWENPSFDGSFLPVNHDITNDGFSAKWEVLDLNTTYSRSGLSTKGFYLPEVDNAFGVKFFLPVDVYQKTTRSVKYAMAVVALVFMLVFMVEMVARKKIHPVQYLLIGFALVIFYTLLLSFAEHIRFGLAYVIASLAIVLMIGWFAKSVMGSAKLGYSTGGVVALLYGFIYILLQMQDFTLMAGSIGLFVILALFMYFSKSVDWYGEKNQLA